MGENGNELLSAVIAVFVGVLLLPTQPFLGGMILVCVGIKGVKYYREHSRLSGVFRNCGLVNLDGQVLQLREKQQTDNGLSLRYSLPPGFTVADVKKHHDAIETFLGRPVSISTALKDVVIDVYEEDLDQYEYTPSTKLVIGRGRSGDVVLDFEKHPHLAVCGETGSGKSVFLRSLITTMLLMKNPTYKLHLIDLKGGTELGIFRNHPNVLSFSRTEHEAAMQIALFADEIDRRYEQFFNEGVIVGKVEHQIMIIDEFAEIDDKSTMNIIRSIVARGRACSCNLILSTQRISADILPGSIKSNLTNLVGLKTINKLNSDIVGISGLERLRGQGHGIFKSGSTLTEFQTPYLSEKRAKELIS